MTVHLSILIFWPLVFAVVGALAPGRALSAAVRGLQSGYLRYYAALLLVGLTGLSFYFLVSS